jgi:arylsulfatase A-like enzyme
VLAELSPLLPPRSSSHGLLKEESVVMWTVESMARDYLAAFSPGSAQTPFIDRLLETGISCSQHFALCPLTNNAHVLLYASRYTGEDGFAPMDALRRAGYRTIYATPCDTRTYGLREILQHAGFEHVLDSPALRNGSRASPSDADLVHSVLPKLRTLLVDGRPFFLHVHTANTHVPYRLSDPAKFCRFDSRTDLGRFLNGLEEADFHLSQFVSRLAELGRPSPPLLVVSADHGQSFGQFGYHSHGSAVVKEQVMVPCLFSHPQLQPRRVPYSTHLDVLPTVLDLLGIRSTSPGFGTSVLAPERPPAWLLWAGHPSRTRTSHFGLVKDERKYMFDWTVDRGYALGWNDEEPRELLGEEKIYYRALISQVATKVGVE